MNLLPYPHLLQTMLELTVFVLCKTSLNHFFKVPEVPKKPVPEKKVPVPAPKKAEAPPAKGIISSFLYPGRNVTLASICKEMSLY